MNDKDTLDINENITTILAELFEGQGNLECQLKQIYSKILSNQRLITSLLKEQKKLRDRIELLEGGG